MLYRRLGKTEEIVSALGFGCMRFPLLDGGETWQIDQVKSMEMIRYAIDMGVNYIDTAYGYHGYGMDKPGESEPFVAKVLKDGYREKVKLATKLPAWLVETREDMDKYLDEQLRRLETDRIDFYLVHSLDKKRWDKVKALGISEFLDSAIEDGRIVHAGFSYHDKPENFNQIIDDYPWSFCQIQFNYLDEDFQAGLDGLNYAYERDIGVVIMEPLRGGSLAEGLSSDVLDVFNKYEIKKTPAQWALEWVLNHPQVGTVLSGMTTMKQTVENVSISSKTEINSLTREELDLVEEAKNVFKSKARVDCTSCDYCMPCPSGVNIPGNFMIYNNYYIFGKSEGYDELKIKERASNCIECGICESQCPQSIEIMAELKNVVKSFE